MLALFGRASLLLGTTPRVPAGFTLVLHLGTTHCTPLGSASFDGSATSCSPRSLTTSVGTATRPLCSTIGSPRVVAMTDKGAPAAFGGPQRPSAASRAPSTAADRCLPNGLFKGERKGKEPGLVAMLRGAELKAIGPVMPYILVDYPKLSNVFRCFVEMQAAYASADGHTIDSIVALRRRIDACVVPSPASAEPVAHRMPAQVLRRPPCVAAV